MHVVEADLERWQPTFEFDVAVGFETIEHLENYETYLDWVRRARRYVIVSVPIVPTKHDNVFHFHDFERDDLVQLIQADAEWRLFQYFDQRWEHSCVYVFARPGVASWTPGTSAARGAARARCRVARHGVEEGSALRQGPIFEVGGRRYDWSDVRDAAAAWGDWHQLEEATRLGLACEQRLELLGVELGAEEVREAARRFRYERNLLAADELSDWLGRWGPDSADWLASVRRSLLRAKWSGEIDDILRGHAVSTAEIEAVIWVEGSCSRMFERVARQLAGRAAAAAAAGGAAENVREIDEGFQLFKTEEITVGAVEKELELRRLDWIRLEGVALTVREEDVAREAALCVRDGMSFDEVAAQAGVDAVAVAWYLDDATVELKPLLLSAEEGSVVGPVRIGEDFLLLRVEAKRLPTSADTDVAGRAEAELVRRAVEREVHQRVRWLDRL